MAVGIVDLPLQRPPQVAWETATGNPSIVGVDGSVAVVVIDEDGAGRSVIGVDMATGDQTWFFEDADHTCQWAVPLVCVQDAGTKRAVVVRIATADGTRAATPYPMAVAAVAAGEDIVVVVSTGSDIEDVVLVEPDGSERWRVQADAADSSSTPAWVSLQVREEAVSLDYPGVSLDLETGEQTLLDWYMLDGDRWVEIQPGGVVAIETPDGRMSVGVDELLLWFDDDAGGPVVLRQHHSGQIVASLRETGDELWRIVEENCWPQARIRQSLVLSCWDGRGEERLVGLDEVTGAVRWEIAGSTWPVTASHDTLLLFDEGSASMFAIDPRNGVEHWRMPWQGTYLSAHDQLPDGLLLSDEDSLTRIVWD